MYLQHDDRGFITVISGDKKILFSSLEPRDEQSEAVAQIEDDYLYYPKDIDKEILIRLAKAYPTLRFMPVEKLEAFIGD